MYTDDEIREKRLLARTAGLRGAELLDNIEAIKRDCNGIGAAWMPDATREWISTANPSLVVVADIHDRRYSIEGTEADRQAADRYADALAAINLVPDAENVPPYTIRELNEEATSVALAQ